jgi:hypothetical protein
VTNGGVPRSPLTPGGRGSRIPSISGRRWQLDRLTLDDVGRGRQVEEVRSTEFVRERDDVGEADYRPALDLHASADIDAQCVTLRHQPEALEEPA